MATIFKASTVTIEGDTWTATLTPAEHAEWEKYADSHPWLFNAGYEPILRMFLANYRAGFNPNNQPARTL